MTLSGLKIMPPRCALNAVTSNLIEKVLGNLDKSDVWTRSISEIYLEPVGVKFDSFFSLNASRVAFIKSQNPQLASESFVTPNPGRPFLLVGTTLIGPVGISWLKSSNRTFTMAEGTPLYFGRPHVTNLTFNTEVGGKGRTIEVGGYIESFAMGSNPPAGEAATSGGSVKVEVNDRPFYLADVLGASSFIAGGALASLPVPLADLEIKHQTWPAGTNNPVGATMLYGLVPF